MRANFLPPITDGNVADYNPIRPLKVSDNCHRHRRDVTLIDCETTFRAYEGPSWRSGTGTGTSA